MKIDINSIYREEIETLAAREENKIFYNSSSEHACIVLNALVRNAKKYIKILCSDMCSSISNNDEYLKLIKKFLSGDFERTLDIVFTEYRTEFHSKPIAKLLSEYPQQVTIKKLGKVRVLYNGNSVNFTVSDDRAFRVETDVANKMAFGNFNEPEQAKKLLSTFDSVFENSIPIELMYC